MGVDMLSRQRGKKFQGDELSDLFPGVPAFRQGVPENLENVEDSASQMADFALSGQTVAQQISMLAGLTAEDADAALQHILCTDRMATMYILPDGTAQAAEEDEEEEE